MLPAEVGTSCICKAMSRLKKHKKKIKLHLVQHNMTTRPLGSSTSGTKGQTLSFKYEPYFVPRSIVLNFMGISQVKQRLSQNKMFTQKSVFFAMKLMCLDMDNSTSIPISYNNSYHTKFLRLNKV